MRAGYAARVFEAHGIVRTVYTAGIGPAVLLMPEMPGISPELLRLANWIRAAGFTVTLPSLFGEPLAEPDPAQSIAVFKRTCMLAEFRDLAVDGSRPITRWLRSLALDLHSRCGGRGVAAIGLCFTGNFAIGLLVEPRVVAAVLGHPSMPMEDPAATGLTPAEAAAVQQRQRREPCPVLALRFRGDRWCTAARMQGFEALLGDRLERLELPDEAARSDPAPFFRDVVRCAHSVLTGHLVDRAGAATLEARDRVIDFLIRELRPGNEPADARCARSSS